MADESPFSSPRVGDIWTKGGMVVQVIAVSDDDVHFTRFRQQPGFQSVSHRRWAKFAASEGKHFSPAQADPITDPASLQRRIALVEEVLALIDQKKLPDIHFSDYDPESGASATAETIADILRSAIVGISPQHQKGSIP